MLQPACLEIGNVEKLAACLIATILVCTVGEAQAGQRLRIVTFNAEILAAPGVRSGTLQRFRWGLARREHLERVASIVETLDPDILKLVEVTSAEAVDHLVRILHEKGLNSYRGYHIESHDTFTGMDVALITKIVPDLIEGKRIRHIYSQRGDPTWRATFSYTDASGTVKQYEASISRNALYFITVADHKLGFLGLHLRSNPSNLTANAHRTAESLVAQRIIREEIVDRGYMPIVLGDLNDYDPDVPDRDESRSTITDVIKNIKDHDRAMAGAELVNVAGRIVRQADRYTSHWDRNENAALDSYDVFTMLDHILIPKQLMPAVRRVFISRSSDLSTSDHWPVVLDLELGEETSK